MLQDIETSTQGLDAAGQEAAQLSLAQLLREITAKSTLLARKEVELAGVEARENFASELRMVKAMAVAVVFAIATLDMIFVAGVFLLARHVDGSVAALIMAGLTLLVAAIAGLIGWKRRVTTPLERTRRTIGDDVKWGKERLA